jgi:flavodoxin
MDPTRALIVYYSRTGATQQAALALREELGCQIEHLVDQTHRTGVVGYVRSSLDALLHRPAHLAPLGASPEDFELVIVGSPVWNASVSAPVRTWLTANRNRIQRIALFVTHGGWNGARAVRQMEEICGKRPVATLVLRADEIESGRFAPKIRSYAAALRSAPAPAEAAGVPKLTEVHA